jgi:hypothetical protein
MKKILILVALATFLTANDFSVGKEITPFSLPDQFEKTHTIDKTTRTIIVSFEKDTGADMNAFLATKSPDYLEKRNAVFIANISEMPSIITKLFAMPKMKKYKHDVLLINDEEDKRFEAKEEKITIYKLVDGVVSKIDFVSTSKEVDEAL